MNLEISGRHIDITPSLRAHIAERVERVVNHLDALPTRCDVVLAVEKERHRAEIRLHFHRHELFAKKEGGDMYAAIDAAADKINRQALDLKRKVRGGEKQARA
jgi:putative sigma-54 modulation protein